MNCKHCNHPIQQFDGEWWHVSKCGVNDGTGNMLPEISLRKTSYIGSHEKKCPSCGHVKDVTNYCKTPQPPENALT